MVKDILLTILGALLISAGAYVAIDPPQEISRVPITLQTLVVLCLAFLMPKGLARASVVLYIIVGIAGLPVFSEGRSGLDYFTSVAAGYLIGFLLAVLIIEWLIASRKRKINFLHVFIYQLLGTFLILVCGWFYLGLRDGSYTGFLLTNLPFLPGALIKSLAGAGIVTLWYRFVPDLWRR